MVHQENIQTLQIWKSNVLDEKVDFALTLELPLQQIPEMIFFSPLQQKEIPVPFLNCLELI